MVLSALKIHNVSEAGSAPVVICDLVVKTSQKIDLITGRNYFLRRSKVQNRWAEIMTSTFSRTEFTPDDGSASSCQNFVP
jgi:hypothetical protein